MLVRLGHFYSENWYGSKQICAESELIDKDSFVNHKFNEQVKLGQEIENSAISSNCSFDVQI